MIDNKYQAVVRDKMKTLKERRTKYYETYQEAHKAGEKLCKKTMGDRGYIDIVLIPN